MIPRDWERLQAIVDGALDLPPEQRAAYLDTASQGDADIRRRAQSLIDAYEKSDGFLDSAIGERAREVLATPAESNRGGTGIEAGKLIGRYLVTGVLGSGGMGDAFSAWDVELDRPVALKFLRRGPLGEPSSNSSAEGFIREAKAASALNHPYIVTVYEVLRSEHGIGIAMELVQGNVLRSLCAEPQPVKLVRRIGEQMADALAAAHAANILHRDIKPENIVLRPDGYIKVLDFGLAKRLDAGTISHPGLPAGTFRYMSPEQTRGQKLTAASDVFSMGVVLFELTAGSHPFLAETALQTLVAIGSGQPNSLAAVCPRAPKELSALVARMLSKDPSARPSAETVARELREIQERLSQPGEASHRLPEAPPAAGARRISPLLLLAAAGIGLTTLSLGLWWTASRSDRSPGAQMFEPTPFATEAGGAAISPDGTQVAYACRSEGLEKVCVRDLGASADRAVSFGKPGVNNNNPAWSPDGKSLAYLRGAGFGQSELIVSSLPGPGNERIVANIGVADNNSGAICWSSDPSRLVVSASLPGHEGFALFLLSTETGEMRRLTHPPESPFGDHTPALAPGGKWLAFSRASADGLAALYVVELDSQLAPKGEPLKLETGRSWNVTPVWTADGRELIFATGTFRRHRLARISAFEATAKPAPLVMSIEGSSSSPAIGKDRSGKPFLMFLSSLSISNLWEVPLSPASATPRQLTSPSSSRDFQPSYSPDGKKFAFVSDRSGDEEVWVADRSGANPTQWTSLHCSKVAIPRWSPDSARITFSAVCGGPGNIYIADGPAGKPRRLVESDTLSENSRWVPGGGWLYFTSFRTGTSMTWKVPEAGGEPAPVSWRVTSNPQMSYDGHALYFTKPGAVSIDLWALPIDPAGEEKLAAKGVYDYRVGRSGLYFRPSDQTLGPVVRLLDSATGRLSTVSVLPHHPLYIFDVSPDEKTVIYARQHLATSDLMRVDGFR